MAVRIVSVEISPDIVNVNGNFNIAVTAVDNSWDRIKNSFTDWQAIQTNFSTWNDLINW